MNIPSSLLQTLIPHVMPQSLPQMIPQLIPQLLPRTGAIPAQQSARSARSAHNGNTLCDLAATDILVNTHIWLVSHSLNLIKSYNAAGTKLAGLAASATLARQPVSNSASSSASSPFYEALCRALQDADQKAPFNDAIFGRVPTWASHFYDPDTQTNWLGQLKPTAVTCGSSYYDLAREAFLNGELAEAGYYLGLSLHYMTDLTQPMHAANFTWFHSWHFGYHTSFEKYAHRRLATLTAPRTYRPPLTLSPTTNAGINTGTSAVTFLKAAARHTKDRFFAAICRPEWIQEYNYFTWTDATWHEKVGQLLPVILTDAVQMTAQYLLMWMDSVYVAPPLTTRVLRQPLAMLRTLAGTLATKTLNTVSDAVTDVVERVT